MATVSSPRPVHYFTVNRGSTARLLKVVLSGMKAKSMKLGVNYIGLANEEEGRKELGKKKAEARESHSRLTPLFTVLSEQCRQMRRVWQPP